MLERFDDPPLIASITLDPGRDTPEVLSSYARAFGAGDGWLFLTGNVEEIETLRRALGVYDPDPVVDADRSQHAGLLVMGNDPLDRWMAVAAQAEPEVIAAAVERLVSW